MHGNFKFTSKYLLTEREKDVLYLCCYTKAQIGQKLFISPATVATIRQHIYEKLNVHTVAAALIKALRYGMIDFDKIVINETEEF